MTQSDFITQKSKYAHHPVPNIIKFHRISTTLSFLTQYVWLNIIIYIFLTLITNINFEQRIIDWTLLFIIK